MAEAVQRACEKKSNDNWGILFTDVNGNKCLQDNVEPMAKNTVIAAYLRVSTEEQEVAMQRTFVESLLKAKGINLDDVKWFIDHDVSATKNKQLDTREEGRKLLQLVEDGLVKEIYCYKLDRMFRNVWAGHKFVAICQENKTDIISGECPQGILDDNGFLLYSIHFMLAEMEIRKLARRTSDGMKERRKRGGVTTSAVFGWDIMELVDSDGKVVIDENDKVVKTVVPNWQEQAVIVWIRERVQEGWSYGKIASELNRIGLKGKKGGKWQSASVKRCLEAKQHKELHKFTPPTRMMKWPFADLRKKQGGN